jgi:transcriptional regulator with XRE-family HTH domain
MSVHATFSDRLGEALRMRGQTLKGLSRVSGYNTSYLCRLRAGDKANPTVGAVWALASALDVSPFWLLGGDDEPGDLHAPYRARPSGLSEAQWADVADLRARGASWPKVVDWLRQHHGVVVQDHSLRRASAGKLSTGGCN